MKESLESEKNLKNKNILKTIFRTIFIRCNCDSEVLVVRYDGEYDTIDLCMYESKLSYKNKMGWYQKIRYIYQILRNGQPYSDQIILHKNQIDELTGFLNSIYK